MAAKINPDKVRSVQKAITNLRWFARAIEETQSINKALDEVYDMGIFGLVGDLRALLRELGK